MPVEIEPALAEHTPCLSHIVCSHSAVAQKIVLADGESVLCFLCECTYVLQLWINPAIDKDLAHPCAVALFRLCLGVSTYWQIVPMVNPNKVLNAWVKLCLVIHVEHRGTQAYPCVSTGFFGIYLSSLENIILNWARTFKLNNSFLSLQVLHDLCSVFI